MAGEGSAVVMTLVPDTLCKFSASHDSGVIPRERTRSTCDRSGKDLAETESGERLFDLNTNKDTVGSEKKDWSKDIGRLNRTPPPPKKKKKKKRSNI